MRSPIRKSGKYTNLPDDPHVTAEKFAELQNTLDRLLQQRPPAAREVQRLAALGDFSENAEYQMAKAKLRGINQRILETENRLKHAVIIKAGDSAVVRLGSTVTLTFGNKKIAYQILGSSETNPSHGVISHHSPIGAALLGHRVGDTINVAIGKKTTSYTIVAIF